MRPYVKEVEFNIQGGGKYALGPKTLIVGANASGKSTITRAIELALSGRASDIAGHDTLALDADLFALAGSDTGAGTLATLSDGGSASWTLGKGKKAKRAGGPVIFPLRDVRAALAGNAETARKFFLSVAADLSWDAVVKEIPPQFHDRLAPYRMKDGAAGLLAVIEGTKKRAREIKAEAKAQRETAALMAQGIPPEPSPDTVERARKAAGLRRAGGLVRDLQAQRAAAQERATSARARLDAALAAVEALPPAGPSLPEVVTHAIAVGEYLAQHDVDACPICGAATPKSKIVFQVRVANAKAKVQSAIDAQSMRVMAEATLREARFEDGAANADLASVVRRMQENGITMADAVPETPEDFEALIRTAERWQSIRVAEGRAVELETDATIVAQLTTLAQTALGRLLDSAVADFTKRVQSFLPSSMEFGIDLQDGEREVFRVGLRTGGFGTRSETLRTALSGAEWATMTAAIAGAILAKSEQGIPAIIVVEDRDFDPKTLGDVMASFTKLDAQVIIAGTKLPAAPVDGWTVINVSEGVGATSAAARDNFCKECSAEIIGGPCPHGIGAPVKKPVGDLFG